MLLSVKATGRDFGNKQAPRETAMTISGVKVAIHEFDAWEGPVGPADKGQYFRFTQLQPVGKIRDDRWGQ